MRALRLTQVLATSGILVGFLGCGSSQGTTSAPAPDVTAPAITTPPASLSVAVGAEASFSVVATGTGPLTYQWAKGGVAIPGATSNPYKFTTSATTDSGVYTVTVTNSAGTVTSAAATLDVTSLAPVITTPPLPQTVFQNSPATFSVVATGTGPLTYQWYEGNTAVAGATSATWTFLAPTVAADNGALITVVVTNGANQKTTSVPVLLTVQSVVTTPVITVQPKSVAVMPPDGATFSVTATGSNLTYAWKKVGSSTVLGTDATYTVAATDLHNLADQYMVTVTNADGSMDSDPATLAVSAPKAVYAGDPTFPGNSNYTTWSSFSCALPADPSGSFRIGYDSSLPSSVWSSACFFPYLTGWTFSRGDYPTDPRIPASPDTSAYTNTGYSRGHQTAFAALRDVYGPDAGSSTMYMSNMVPQVQNFNAGAYEALEGLGQVTLPGAFGRVWVYTGPIYSTPLVLPIGPKNLPVPTAFYKVMVRETAPGQPKVLAVIVPHSTTIGIPAVPFDTKGKDTWKFVTSVDRVQALTGLTFFPTPSTPLPAGFTSTVDVRGWGAGLEQGPAVPNVHIIDPSWDSTFTHVHNNTGAVTTISTHAGVVGTPIKFEAQATPGTDPIATTTWDFGDGQTANTLSAPHTYNAAGNFNVTFTATDSTSHKSTLTRSITVVGASPSNPVMPTISDVAMTVGTPVTKVFYVSDPYTLAGNIKVTATSSAPAVLADNLVVSNLNGTCSLTLNPLAAGSATITVIATDAANLTTTQTFTVTAASAPPPVSNSFTEGFNSNLKGGYALGTITLPSGSWTMMDALMGNIANNDVKNGTYAIRIQNKTAGTVTGKVTMNFDWPAGAKTVSFLYARYGTEGVAGTLGLFYSIDQGANWVSAGADITDATTTTFKTATYTLNINKPIRFEIRRIDSLINKMNIDDFCVTGF